jgi:hypothetical protein
MLLRINLFVFFTIICNTCFSQIIEIKGKVIDENDKTNLNAATITSGNIGTTTNSTGEFYLKVDLNVLLNKGIYLSSVGYLSKHVIFQSGIYFYNVEMVKSINNLAEVKIYGNGFNIIKKAYDRIVINYPNNPYKISGIGRIQFYRNNSDFFKSDAILEGYVPSYATSKETEVKVVQNKVDSIVDKSLPFIRLVEAYKTIVTIDKVKKRGNFIKPSEKDSYSYTILGKGIYDNHEVYIIDVKDKDTLKETNQLEGQLYIDTASYAYVGISMTNFNVIKSGYLTHAKSYYSIAYQQLAGKWYIKEVHTRTNIIYKNENPIVLTDFVGIKVDTLNAKPFSYKEKIQNGDATQKIKIDGEKAIWPKYDSLFYKEELNNRISKVSPLLIDTIKKGNYLAPKNINVLNYLRKDNFMVSLSAIRFPLMIGNETNNEKHQAFGLDAKYYFKVVKHLFLEVETGININKFAGIDILDYKVADYGISLSNQFILKYQVHPTTISPIFGYHLLNYSDNVHQLNFNGFSFGLRTSYELTHILEAFFSPVYNFYDVKKLSKYNIELSNYTSSIGFLVKI